MVAHGGKPVLGTNFGERLQTCFVEDSKSTSTIADSEQLGCRAGDTPPRYRMLIGGLNWIGRRRICGGSGTPSFIGQHWDCHQVLWPDAEANWSRIVQIERRAIDERS